MRRLLTGLLLTVAVLLSLVPVSFAAGGGPKVYVLRIDGGQVIDAGLAQFVDRVFNTAEADPDAAAVAVVLDTPGGMVESANRIKDRLLNSRLKTIAFVEGGAISAGALIATAAEEIYMHPGSVIGAAEPRVAGTNETADYKALAVVTEYFTSAAVARGRDPELARAMVDKNFPIPGQKGALLALNFDAAISQGYADGEAADLDDAILQAGIAEFELYEPEWTTSERAGRLLTTPWVAILLLVVGVISLGIEFMKPGLTGPGALGLICLGLFFVGNTLVGTSGWVEVSLAIIGLLLLVAEFFVPGFGIFGLAGVGAVGAAIFLAVPSADLAWRYMLWTAVAGAVVFIMLLRTISKRGLGRVLTLSDSARGWTSQIDRASLVGREGESTSVLRPAGTAQIGDQRLDVVTEGEFLPSGVRVKVIRVEGTRIVVRATDK